MTEETTTGTQRCSVCREKLEGSWYCIEATPPGTIPSKTTLVCKDCAEMPSLRCPESSPEITLRDFFASDEFWRPFFAGCALGDSERYDTYHERLDDDWLSARAYRLADVMLAAKKAREQGETP